MGELQDLIEELSSMSVKDRIRKLKLRSDRADVILPATVVLQLIAREAGVKQVAIPHVGLKDGLLLDMATDMKLAQGTPRREQVWESAIRLGQKYQFDANHARLTARLASHLFDHPRSFIIWVRMTASCWKWVRSCMTSVISSTRLTMTNMAITSSKPIP